jgi:hypothetical protein
MSSWPPCTEAMQDAMAQLAILRSRLRIYLRSRLCLLKHWRFFMKTRIPLLHFYCFCVIVISAFLSVEQTGMKAQCCGSLRKSCGCTAANKTESGVWPLLAGASVCPV